MDDLERQRELRRERDRLLDVPNCPACLHRTEATDEGWRCTACGHVSQPDSHL